MIKHGYFWHHPRVKAWLLAFFQVLGKLWLTIELGITGELLLSFGWSDVNWIYLFSPFQDFTMQRILIIAILFAILLSHVSLCRRGGSSGKRPKKSSTGSNTKPSTPTTVVPSYGNLCYGGQMLDDVELQMKDIEFYRANWKSFPDGLHYPNCAPSLQSNTTKGVLLGECVNFTISSSKLNLPAGMNSSNQIDRVMWQVINHLCASESCSLSCPPFSSARGLPYLDPWLILGLIGCFIPF